MVDITDAQGSGIRRNGVNVTKVYEIGAFGIQRALRDVTALSDIDCHKHKLNLPDIAEISIKAWYDPQDTTHLQIISDGHTGGNAVWQIDVQSGDSPAENITFEAFVINPQIEGMAVDGDLTLSFSLKAQTVPVGLYESAV